jgi:Phage-related minor tail protein
MKLLGVNIKDEYVWIGGAVLVGAYLLSNKAFFARAYPAMACSNGHCIESDDDNVGIQCVNGVCTKTEGSDSMTQTSEDGSTMTSTDPEVAQKMIDRINRQIRRQQREITDEATGNYARAYAGDMAGGAGMSGGDNGLGQINNDFMAQLQDMIRQAVAEGMQGAGGQDSVGQTGANANGLPGLDANGSSSHGGMGGHGGIGGAGGAGGHGGMGGHMRAGGGGGWGGRRKKRGMGGGAAGGHGGAGAGGHGGGGMGAGKKKGGAGAGKGAAKTKTPPDCTDPNNAALPECANADTSATDSGFAMAYTGTYNNYAYQGDADDIDEYYDSYTGTMEDMYADDEDDYFKSYNTGNTFDLNMPTNPITASVYGNTRYDQMSPYKVVTA